MNKKFLYISFLLVSCSLFSCQKENMGDCFKSTGSMVKQARAVEIFDRITLEDRINLILSQSSRFEVTVEAGENLQKSIKTKIADGMLSIVNENKCNWVRSLKKDINVYVSLPSINAITYRGGGKIQFNTAFNQENFYLDSWDASGSVDLNLNCVRIFIRNHEGTADVKCAGSAQTLESYSNAQGKIDTRNTVAGEALVINNSSGQMYVQVQGNLKAEIRGSGNIYSYGNPVIVGYDKMGSGNLIAN